MILRLIFTFAFSFAMSTSFAQETNDILLLDLNSSLAEIETVEQCVKEMNEQIARNGNREPEVRVRIVPQVDREMLKRVDETRRSYDKAHKRMEAVCGRDAVGVECTDAKKEDAKLRGEMRAAEMKIKYDGPLNIRRDIAKLRSEGFQTSTLVISGHDADGQYEGVAGGLTEDELECIADQTKPVLSNPRSLVLAGCYTGTSQMFRDSFRKIMPNKGLIFGYGASGPSGLRQEGRNLLCDFLQREKAINAEKDVAKVEQMVRSMRGMNDTAGAICKDREHIITKGRTRTISGIDKRCDNEPLLNDIRKAQTVPRAHERLKRNITAYDCYRSALPGCERVPENSKTGDLRELYEYVQATAACHQNFVDKGDEGRPNAADARRVLFDKSIRSVYASRFAKELGEIDKLIDSMGLPANLKLGKNFGSLGRKDYLEKVDALQKAFIGLSDRYKDRNGNVWDPKIAALGNYVDQLHRMEDGNCFPLSWAGVGIPRADTCGLKEDMASVPAKTAEDIRAAAARIGGIPADAANNLRQYELSMPRGAPPTARRSVCEAPLRNEPAARPPASAPIQQTLPQPPRTQPQNTQPGPPMQLGPRSRAQEVIERSPLPPLPAPPPQRPPQR